MNFQRKGNVRGQEQLKRRGTRYRFGTAEMHLAGKRTGTTANRAGLNLKDSTTPTSPLDFLGTLTTLVLPRNDDSRWTLAAYATMTDVRFLVRGAGPTRSHATITVKTIGRILARLAVWNLPCWRRTRADRSDISERARKWVILFFGHDVAPRGYLRYYRM